MARAQRAEPHAAQRRAGLDRAAHATRRPELERAVTLARDLRATGVAVTLVVHAHKHLGRGIDLATLAEKPKAAGSSGQRLKFGDRSVGCRLGGDLSRQSLCRTAVGRVAQDSVDGAGDRTG